MESPEAGGKQDMIRNMEDVDGIKYRYLGVNELTL